MHQPDLFTGALPPAAVATLQRMNPHWRGEPQPVVPRFHRTLFAKLHTQLRHGLAPGVVRRGPRRGGKAVLVRQLIDRLLAEGVPKKSPAKICTCDHGLRASWLQEVIPLDPDAIARDPHPSDLAGRIAESALGYMLATVPNLEVTLDDDVVLRDPHILPLSLSSLLWLR